MHAFVVAMLANAAVADTRNRRNRAPSMAIVSLDVAGAVPR
jgi:hypothetical protein